MSYHFNLDCKKKTKKLFIQRKVHFDIMNFVVYIKKA